MFRYHSWFVSVLFSTFLGKCSSKSHFTFDVSCKKNRVVQLCSGQARAEQLPLRNWLRWFAAPCRSFFYAGVYYNGGRTHFYECGLSQFCCNNGCQRGKSHDTSTCAVKRSSSIINLRDTLLTQAQAGILKKLKLRVFPWQNGNISAHYNDSRRVRLESAYSHRSALIISMLQTRNFDEITGIRLLCNFFFMKKNCNPLDAVRFSIFVTHCL